MAKARAQASKSATAPPPAGTVETTRAPEAKTATAPTGAAAAPKAKPKAAAGSKIESKWVSAAPAAKPAKAPARKTIAKTFDEWVNEPGDDMVSAVAPPPPVDKPAFGERARRAPAKAAAKASPKPRLEPARSEPAAPAAPPAAKRVRKRTAAPKTKAEPPAAATPATKPNEAASSKPVGAAKPAAPPAPVEAAKPAAPSKPAAPAPTPAAKAEPKPAVHTEPFSFSSQYPIPDFEALARNAAAAIEHAGKAFAAYMRPRESGEIKSTLANDVGEMVRSFGQVAEYYLTDPKRALAAQTALASQFINLWAATLQRFQGQPAKPIAEPTGADKRFSDAEWKDNPFFDFVKQAYVLTTDWAEDLVKHADEMEPHARDKARFYLRQATAALAPSNFVGTNPELLRATLAESGENLARGLKMLAEDIEAGNGNLRIRQVDARAFKLGVNMAVTPGKVVFRNDLIELIQYAPTTAEVYKRPLLVIPPWINKFYILDLNPEKSFIRWAVDQGLTVFVVSWVNPDARHAEKDFDAYMREGILAALAKVEEATGEHKITTIGYCVGGTLLGATLGYMASVGDDRIDSATFFTTQIDFTDPGDLKVFVDAEQLKQVEARMAELGYLEGAAMAQAFNMLRPNDLIWSYYVNNYLKGKEPMPFDLLVWNSDSTRMPAANHAFYLRHCYYQNDLSNGRMTLGGKRIDLKTVKIPIYELAAKEDHIAPARSAFNGAKCFGGPVRYVMAGSGHIAGVVNPPSKTKYQYWTGGPVTGAFEDWVKAAKETPGSWWPDWIRWIAEQAPEKVPAREPGAGELKAIGDAPGEYVRMKS
jgi:polyhydroxyalkanoate synthase